MAGNENVNQLFQKFIDAQYRSDCWNDLTRKLVLDGNCRITSDRESVKEGEAFGEKLAREADNAYKAYQSALAGKSTGAGK